MAGKRTLAVVTAAALGVTWWLAGPDAPPPPAPAPARLLEPAARSASAASPSTATPPAGPSRVADLEAALAAERARTADLEAALAAERARTADLEARLAATLAPATLRERVRQLVGISDARQRAVRAWRLGEELRDDAANRAPLLDLLLGEQDPATLEALSLVLRSGPLLGWTGERAADVQAALRGEPPARRRLAAQLLGAFLRRADVVDSGLDPALVDGVRSAVVAAVRAGDDGVVIAYGEELASFGIAPTPAEADALWAAAGLVRTHEARVQAVRVVLRGGPGGRGRALQTLLTRWEGERRDDMRAAMAAALASAWRQTSGPYGDDLEQEGAVVERLLPDLREASAREVLVRAWLRHACLNDGEPLERLRRLIAREPDAALAARLAAFAERAAAGPFLGSRELDAALEGR